MRVARLSDIGQARVKRAEQEALKHAEITRGIRVRLVLGSVVMFEERVAPFTQQELEWFRRPIK